MRLLEAVRLSRAQCRFYQASSSEMFGASPPPQNEQTPFCPRSPYGAAKVYSYWATRNYREAYGLFAVNGILFNHESPRRGETFVTRKITRAVARIKAGIESHAYLGNLDAVRDWGYAPEYVEGMWRMLQSSDPDDFVLATGRGYTVREFAQTAFDHAGLDWEKHVRFDERYPAPHRGGFANRRFDQGLPIAGVEGFHTHRRTGADHGRSWWTRTSLHWSVMASHRSTSRCSPVGHEQENGHLSLGP